MILTSTRNLGILERVHSRFSPLASQVRISPHFESVNLTIFLFALPYHDFITSRTFYILRPDCLKPTTLTLRSFAKPELVKRAVLSQAQLDFVTAVVATPQTVLTN